MLSNIIIRCACIDIYIHTFIYTCIHNIYMGLPKDGDLPQIWQEHDRFHLKMRFVFHWHVSFQQGSCGCVSEISIPKPISSRLKPSCFLTMFPTVYCGKKQKQTYMGVVNQLSCLFRFESQLNNNMDNLDNPDPKEIVRPDSVPIGNPPPNKYKSPTWISHFFKNLTWTILNPQIQYPMKLPLENPP